MKTLQEKISFIITAICYLLFHLRLGSDFASITLGTLHQMLLTAPYALGFACLLTVFIRNLAGGVWPPWDRIARIFFTIGIIFAFIVAIYERMLGPEWKEILQDKISSGWLR